MRKHHEQLVSLAQRACFAFIQLLVATALCEELIKRVGRSDSLGWVGRASIVQEIVIQLPEPFAKVLQEVTMVSKAGAQLLVMTKFMNPAQSQFCGERIELGSIITQQEARHRIGTLGSIDRNR